MGRRRFTAVSVTGDVDDLIGLDDIGQEHIHTADIIIGAESIGTTNHRFQERDANSLELRDLADLAYTSLVLKSLGPESIDGTFQGSNIDIYTDESNTKYLLMHSHDGGSFVQMFKAIGGRGIMRFPDKNGAAGAGDFIWDPAGGGGFEGFVYDYANGRLYFYGNGGVHYINVDV